MVFALLRRLFKPKGVDAGNLARLEKVLRYDFRNPQHLQTSLSHRSYCNTLTPRPQSNERLEFLGDAILNAVVTDYLYRRYPECEEGQLSQMKSLVVSAKVLEICARQWDLGQFILLSKSEEKSGGRKRQSILADAYEAVLGAIFLDGGYPAATRLIRATLFQIMDEVLADEDLANYKSLLLEFTQGKGFGVPAYEVVKVSGPEHRKNFVVAVKLQGREWGRGVGPSKKAAEQSGARMALESHGGRLTSEGREADS